VNLIGDVLDIEKLEAGQMTVEEDVVNLLQVVNESIEAVRGVAEQTKITIESKVVEDADVDVLGDNDRLVQVMVNLLSNAIKFSPEGSSIQIAIRAVQPVAEVRITDHGRGIPASNIEIIFERFKQSQTSDGKRAKGTGLGLAICKAIIEAHKGTIGVESKEGEGSTFWFKLPLYEDPEDLRTAAEARPEVTEDDDDRKDQESNGQDSAGQDSCATSAPDSSAQLDGLNSPRSA
jgi:signal transduction histidine kinase